MIEVDVAPPFVFVRADDFRLRLPLKPRQILPMEPPSQLGELLRREILTVRTGLVVKDEKQRIEVVPIFEVGGCMMRRKEGLGGVRWLFRSCGR